MGFPSGLEIRQVDQKIKIVGATLDPNDGYTPYFVTDADDPHKPTLMYRSSESKNSTFVTIL